MEKSASKLKLDRKMFIRKRDKFLDYYQINPKPIGKGAYGQVYLCVNRITKEIRAVKIVFKHTMENVDNFLNEIECLKNLVNSFK